MTEGQIRSKMAENTGIIEGTVKSTLRLFTTGLTLDSRTIKQAKTWLQEALDLFEENDKLHKELIKVLES